MKAIYAAFILSLFVASGYAQSSDLNFELKAGFDIHLGGGLFPNLRHASFEAFRDKYNVVNKSTLTRELGNLQPESSFCYGGGAHIGPLYLGFIKYNTIATAKAQLKDGSSREFKLEFKPLDVNFDLLFPIGSRVHTGMAIGMQLQKARLYSGYRYPNGYLSYSEDRALNGVFDFWANSQVNCGFRLDVGLVKRKGVSLVALSLRAEKLGAFSKFLSTAPELLPLRDEMMNNVDGGSTFTDGDLHLYLPEDPANANNVYSYNVGQGTFNGTYQGWRFAATLVLVPVEWILND